MTGDNEMEDPGKRLFRQAQECETWREFLKILYDFGEEAYLHFKNRNAPLTTYLIAISLGIFTIQTVIFLAVVENPGYGILIVLTQMDAFEGLNAYVFINYPWIAWPLAGFTHRGIGHILANILLLILFGKIVEREFRTRGLILWFVGVTIISKLSDAFVIQTMDPDQYVAVYGVSDFGFSLAFFSVAYLVTSEKRNELEYIALGIGLLSIALVLIEMIQGLVQMSIEPVNIQHLVGGLLGLCVYGIFQIKNRDVRSIPRH